MKLCIKIFAVLMLAAIMLLFSGIPISAAGSSQNKEVRYTKKIVSVVYDNSGSMIGSKNHYSLYALQMLMALLDEKDTLVITPMNIHGSTIRDTSQCISVDLSLNDRNAEIQRVLSNDILQSPSGGTPGTVIGVAIDQLENFGLYNSANIWKAEDNVEHWLVILTDGVLNEQSSSHGAADIVEDYIYDFPSLKTIFLGLGSDSPSLTDIDQNKSGQKLSEKYVYTPYRAENTNEFVSSMQKVANKLSGRYTFDSSFYSVSGSKVTIDLSKADVSFKSISVIAQDCNATLVSAKHNGRDITIVNPCVIKPNSNLGIQNGFSAVLKDSPNLMNGTLELQFSSPITVNNLSVLAEPALTIRSYLEYKNGSNWFSTDMQYINANLSKNDTIRVGYKVYEQANGKQIDLNKLFGNIESSVTYAGKSYDIGEEIPLVVGNNEISVTVSVMDGAYTMYSSTTCIIEENPTYYRVEATDGYRISPNNIKGEAKFVVYLNNKTANKAALSAYTWSVTATGPDGKTIATNSSMNSNGEITASFNAEKHNFGEYTLNFEILSSYGMARTASSTFSYTPDSIEIIPTIADNIPHGGQSTPVKFTVKADGEQIIGKFLSDYTISINMVTPNGKTVSLTPSLNSDGTVFSELKADKGGYGAYAVEICVAAPFNKNAPIKSTHTVNYSPSDFEISCEHESEFKKGSTQSSFVYTIKADNFALSRDYVSACTWNVAVTAPNGTKTNVNASLGNDGKITAQIEAVKGVYGNYTVEMTMTAPNGNSKCITENINYSFSDIEIISNIQKSISSSNTTSNLEYKVYIDGKQLLSGDLEKYELSLKCITPDGTEIEIPYQTNNDGKISAKLNVDPGKFGDYIVDFTVIISDNKSESSFETIEYYPASVELFSNITGELSNGVTNIEIEHSIVVEGKQLTLDELNKYVWEVKGISPDKAEVNLRIDVESDGTIKSLLDVSSTGFGSYDVTLSLMISDSYTEEKTITLKFYPNTISTSISEGNNLSVSEHQMNNNTSPIKFDLSADGLPFSFDNGLTSYMLTVDGVDVSSYASVEGSTLVYIPQITHFNNSLSVGDKVVKLEISCAEATHLSSSVSTTLSITETKYEIISISVGNKPIDRFDLFMPDCALYFQVMRDNIPLSIEELQSAINSGDLQINDIKGVFTWKFWVPCAAEISVIEVESQPTIEYRITRDWIRPFHTFAAMLISDGDKPVTLSYMGVSGADSVVFMKSGIWSYIWRILVILFAIHTLLYLVGFINRKCNNFPSGVIVSASLNGDTGKVSFKVSKKINIKFKDKLIWHLIRFVPNKHGYLWYNQPTITGPTSTRSIFGFDENGNFGVSFKDMNAIYRISPQMDSSFIDDLNTFRTKLRRYNGKGVIQPLNGYSAFEIRNTLGRDFDADPIPANVFRSAGDIYGKYDKDGKLKTIVFFVANINN